MRDLTKYAVMSAVMSAMLICTLPVYGTTVHDNRVYFEQVHGFTWNEAEHKISDGQPWESIGDYYNSSKHRGEINIRAGRHKTTAVADWFKDKGKKGHGGHATGLDTPDTWPDELNFATYGHFKFKDHNGRWAICHELVIGQGSNFWGNNWWIAGANLHEYGGEVWLTCPPTSIHHGAVIPISSDGTNYFKLNLWMVPRSSGLSLSSNVLWPADGEMHEIEAIITVEDDHCVGSSVIQLISVESSEPDSEDDIQEAELYTDDRVFKLRAECSNGGDGRVYTVTYDIVDGCGMESTLETTVTVPHDKGKNPPPHFRGKK